MLPKYLKDVAENVLKDYTTNEEALKAWLNSDDHKKNIEGNYTHTTVSIQKNINEKRYFIQIFFK